MNNIENKKTNSVFIKMKIDYVKIQTAEQIDFLVDIAKDIWTEHFGPIFNDDEILNAVIEANQSKTIILDQIKNIYQYFFITHEDKIIGYFSYKLNEENLFISKLYLVSSERRKGIGKQVLEHLELLAINKGKTKLSLTVFYKNPIAINAYLKNGFKNVETIERDFGEGVICIDYTMEKIIR